MANSHHPEIADDLAFARHVGHTSHIEATEQGRRRREQAARRIDQRRQAIVDEIPRLRRYARALLRNRDAADDLVQDSLERALSRMESWATGDSPRRWLLTIMHHRFVDQSRRAKRHLQAVTAMPATMNAIAMPPPQVDKLASLDVLLALQQIGPERRAALALVAVEGLSYADAAHALGIGAGTLASRIARGREELRSVLDDAGRRDVTTAVGR
jgi:RNA polymerase sigma-70 factor (ECF subfamily)